MRTKRCHLGGFARLGSACLCAGITLAALIWLVSTGAPAVTSSAAGAAEDGLPGFAGAREEAQNRLLADQFEPSSVASAPFLPADSRSTMEWLWNAPAPPPTATAPAFRTRDTSEQVVLSRPSSGGSARGSYAGLLPEVCPPGVRDAASTASTGPLTSTPIRRPRTTGRRWRAPSRSER